VAAGLFDRGPDLGLLVHGQVIEHDDIARPQSGHQHLFDVGEKRRAIDRTIEDRWRAQPLQAKGGDHRVRLPVAAGRVVSESCAARTPPVAAQEIGRDTAFIEKDVLAHIAKRLPLAPAPTVSGDIGPPLFVGVNRFF
jgi:hypothetical protein